MGIERRKKADSKDQVTFKRIPEFDVIKGIGMLVVMIFHIVYRTRGGIADNIIRASLIAVIAGYFVISGLLHGVERRTIIGEYINKFKHLVLPTVVVTFVASVFGGIYCHIVHGMSASAWIRNIVYIYLRPELSVKVVGNMDPIKDMVFLDLSTTWFAWTLIIAYIVFIPLSKLILKSQALSIAATVAMFVLGNIIYVNVGSSPWNASLVPLYVSAMLLVQHLKYENIVAKIRKMNIVASITSTIAAMLAMFGMYFYILDDHMYEAQLGVFHLLKFKHWSYPYGYAKVNPLVEYKGLIWIEGTCHILAGLICLYVGINIARYIRKIRGASKLLEYIGKNSLYVMILHSLIALPFVDLLHCINKMGAKWYLDDLTPEITIKSIICAILSLVCCLIICRAKDTIYPKIKKGGR